MAKLPDNRYQTINELLEDLTIAAGMTVLKLDPIVPATTPIVTPDDDEITVVRPRIDPVATPRRAQVTVPVAPHFHPPAQTPVQSSTNPLKILIPSAVGLLVVFAVVFAFTRQSPPANTNTGSQPTLIADPNSQPVKPGQSPTGRGEEGIPAGGVITPPANANVNTNVNANAAVSPSPIAEVSPANANANENSNSNRKAPALPEPSKAVTPDNGPLPPPPGSKSPAVKPSPSPEGSPDGR
jgi:hypothetical protein